MNFFEKAQARAEALKTLGLEGHPEFVEIKSAYKRLIFANHPDRGMGTDEDICRIKEAFNLLRSDQGFTRKDMESPAPADTADTGDTSFHDISAPSRPSPRPVRTGMSARIKDLQPSATLECKKLLSEVECRAEPDAEETSLRASIMSAIKSADAPYVRHTDHLPYAVRQSGRRISYMVGELIREGVNRVAVPTGVFTDNRKVRPIIVRFKADEDGIGTHNVAAATLAEAFPGAKSVRLHFGLASWPKSAAEADRLCA